MLWFFVTVYLLVGVFVSYMIYRQVQKDEKRFKFKVPLKSYWLLLVFGLFWLPLFAFFVIDDYFDIL